MHFAKIQILAEFEISIFDEVQDWEKTFMIIIKHLVFCFPNNYKSL